jgi:hypothetical protein
MLSFYSNFKAGYSIEDSYSRMIQSMKKQYPNEPFKWASFVLLR